MRHRASIGGINRTRLLYTGYRPLRQPSMNVETIAIDPDLIFRTFIDGKW